ncbi:hypothetical protein FSPOR_7554 [Fusarium sporotrichioides]|uniref:Heterokaryon incompatibility domain-containing protein n=1 Tax=Fusarium sporotrichioides TaxID=5514 RepID=A0A395RYQ1_FUSSP|nr:hypothetical protein FSPOR_7554 [Fusarium sporotrichioides]
MRRFLQSPLRSQLNKWRYYLNLTDQRYSSRLYKPLNPETSQIRLLKIPQDQSSGFELVTVSLDDKPRYAALSYLWGKPEHYGKITIEGDTVKIPDNLASAFLCILSDEPFRSQSYCQSQQVQLMRRIFQLAHVTFAWVGPKDYSLAFETIETLDKITNQNTTRKSIAPNGLFDSKWLRGHSELCLNKELDLPNNHLSDPWFAVADFLQHQYWKRTWIFQEVVLADQLVFISPGGSNLAWSTLRGIGTNFIASMRDDMERPDFLSDTAWDLISNRLSWGRISWLFLAQARTKIPDPDGFKGWIISTFAANLEATDHRDYIYGLLAVSDIPVSPNYSPENKASHVYTKYIAGWLKAARTQKTMHVHTPLVFLSLAGVGKFGKSDLPSWVPNYPNNMDVSLPWCYEASDFKPLAQGMPSSLPADVDTYPLVIEETQSLCAWGVDMGSVTLMTDYQRGTDDAILASFMSLASSFTSRNSLYVSGIPAAQAIIRLLLINSSQYTTRDLIDTAMNLALLIAYFNQVPSDTVQKTWGNDWDRDILKLAFPTVDVTQFGINSNILSELSSWDRQRRRDATFATVPLLYLYQFFETSEGYLGAVDYQVLEGDRLCALAGYNEAVILRPNANGSYAFVGSTSVIDIDADHVLQAQKAQSKWLDLQ